MMNASQHELKLPAVQCCPSLRPCRRLVATLFTAVVLLQLLGDLTTAATGATVGIPCGGNVTAASNTAYAYRGNCTLETSLVFNEAMSDEVTNVSVAISGPSENARRLSIYSTVVGGLTRTGLRLRNVSVTIVNVSTVVPAVPTGVPQPRWLLMDLTAASVDGLTVVLRNASLGPTINFSSLVNVVAREHVANVIVLMSTGVDIEGVSFRPLIMMVSKSIRDVDMRFDSVDVRLQVDPWIYPLMSALLLIDGVQLANVHVVVSNSNISAVSSHVMASLLSVCAANAFSMQLVPHNSGAFNDSFNVSLRVHRSVLTHVLNCTDRSTMCTNGDWGAIVRLSSVVVYVYKHTLRDVLVEVVDSHVASTVLVPSMVATLPLVRLGYNAVGVFVYTLLISGDLFRGNVSHANITVRGSALVGLGSREVAGVHVEGIKFMHAVSVAVTEVTSRLQTIGAPLYFAQTTRLATTVFLNAHAAINTTVLVQRVEAHHAVFSGAVAIPSVLANSSLTFCVASFISMQTHCNSVLVDIHESTLYADVRNGSAVAYQNLFPATYNSITVCLISFEKLSPVSEVRIASRGCHIDAVTGMYVPSALTAGSVFCSVTMVSLIVNAVNCSVAIVDGSIRAVPFDVAVENAVVSAAVVPFSVVSLLMGTDPTLIAAIYFPILAVVRPDVFSTTTNTNLEVLLTGCSLSYLGTVNALETFVAAVSLPAMQVHATIRICNTSSLRPLAAPLHLALCVWDCTLQNWHLWADGVTGAAALFASLSGDVLVSQDSSLVFDNVVATALSLPSRFEPMAAVAMLPVFVAVDPTVKTIQLLDTSTLVVNASRFSGFASLGNGSELRCGEGTTPQEPQILLGCNLWDGAAMRGDDIGPSIPHEWVAFPRGAFRYDANFVCPGLYTGSLIASETASEEPQGGEGGDVLPLVPNLISASNVATAAGLASSIGSVVPRSAVGAVQGAIGLLRLAARCHDSDDSDENEEKDEVGSSTLDNPLQLHFNIDTTMPELRYVTGGIVGNTLFVAAIGVALHGGARLVRRVEERRGNRKLSATGAPTAAVEGTSRLVNACERLVLELLPRTLWPGCLIVPFGILLEPLTMMCVLLMGLANPSAGALGGVILALWAGYIGCLAWQVLYRYQPFPLTGDSTERHRRRRHRRDAAKIAPAVAARETDESTAVVALTLRLRLCRLATFLLEPTHMWSLGHRDNIDDDGGNWKRQGKNRDMEKREAAATLVAHYACVFEAYRPPYQWFFLAESGCTLFTGVVLGAAMTSDPSSACTALQWAGWLLFALYIGMAVGVLGRRPFAVRSDGIAVVVVQLLCAGAAVATIFGDADGAATYLALTASLVELFMTAIGLVSYVASMRRRMWRLERLLTSLLPAAQDDAPAAHPPGCGDEGSGRVLFQPSLDRCCEATSPLASHLQSADTLIAQFNALGHTDPATRLRVMVTAICGLQRRRVRNERREGRRGGSSERHRAAAAPDRTDNRLAPPGLPSQRGRTRRSASAGGGGQNSQQSLALSGQRSGGLQH